MVDFRWRDDKYIFWTSFLQASAFTSFKSSTSARLVRWNDWNLSHGRPFTVTLVRRWAELRPFGLTVWLDALLPPMRRKSMKIKFATIRPSSAVDGWPSDWRLSGTSLFFSLRSLRWLQEIQWILGSWVWNLHTYRILHGGNFRIFLQVCPWATHWLWRSPCPTL